MCLFEHAWNPTQISLIFHLAYKRSNFALSSSLQKLAWNLVKARACDVARGGVCGGTQARDEPPHLKSLNLVCLGAVGSLEAIRD